MFENIRVVQYIYIYIINEYMYMFIYIYMLDPTLTLAHNGNREG